MTGASGVKGRIISKEGATKMSKKVGTHGRRAVVGSQKEHDRYHHPDCPNARKIIYHNHAEWYNSPEEAEACGKKPGECAFCKKHLPELSK